MKHQFHITGLFYEIEGYKFRKYLNIKKKNSLKQEPDLMVIMMNPGASRPLDGIDNNIIESEAIPDRTQDQIMKVMTACKFEYARVLNLTDIREPKSQKMFLKLIEMDNKGVSHSIFDARRRNEFDSLFVEKIQVIFAWGVSKNLQELAEQGIKTINIDKPIGLNKEGVEWAYYHPLPQNYKKQIEWVEKTIEILNNYEDHDLNRNV